jgi:steroid 5-alpha reductase family enzyme
MNRDDRVAWLGLPLLVLGGLAFALAIGGGALPQKALLPVALAFVIQWVAFIPAFLQRSEKFYDLVGGLSFISVAGIAAVTGPPLGTVQWLVLAMVLLWAGRLAGFLFLRVHKSGKDQRFDSIKHSFPRFLMAWTFQGFWVTFSLAAALVVLSSPATAGHAAFTLLGSALWLAGISIEITADLQKYRFRSQPHNRGKFIQCGLWRWSRHPNYFGEILLWTGIAVIAIPFLNGWQYATLLSPVMVYLLLTQVSGVPILEKHADNKWGDQADYEAYKRTTPVLFPRPPRG